MNLQKALDTVNLNVRQSKMSKEQTIGAMYVLSEVSRLMKLEQCTQCMRYFKGLQMHRVSHFKFEKLKEKE